MEFLAVLLLGSSTLVEWCALTARNPLEVIRAAVTGGSIPPKNSWNSLGGTIEILWTKPQPGGETGGPLIDGEGGVIPPPAVGRNADGRRNTIVAYARAQLGKPYVWATSGPRTFDCSGLTMSAYDQVGIKLVHYTVTQENDPRGHTVSEANALPGDLCFWGTSSSHVAIYIGGGQMIEAPKSGENVKISSLRETGTSGALRIRSFFKDN